MGIVRALLVVSALVSAPVASLAQAPEARQLFGAARAAAPLEARAIGAFARGCLAGAVALPVDGQTWQVMRLERNRNWGHPAMLAFLERFAREVPRVSSWPGILVGDISQPRGGPMLTGHASHQIGLDADIWLTPMPRRTLSRDERREMSATNVVAADWNDVDPAIWTRDHVAVLRHAAKQPEVSRVLVNPAIKRALCRDAGPTDRAWLRKVRPWWGHNFHFHVRIACPDDSPECREQDAVPPGEGCGADLDWWFSREARTPRNPNAPPPRQLTMADLPAACARVLAAP
jgi:penicillin-insensitive murein DD-endopeptidase